MIANNKFYVFGVNLTMILFVISCIFPFLLLIMSSVTSESTLMHHGYSLIPRELSFGAYQYLWNMRGAILRAYMMSFIIAGVGVSTHVTLTILFAYPLSKKDLPGRNVISFLVFFTMLFNGGLVPTFMVYTRLLNVTDSLAGMIVPYLLLNAFHIIIMRSYISASIPGEVIEAAKVDGASEFTCFSYIIVPMSKPIISTIALLATIAYWNNWTNGVYFLFQRTDLFGIQNFLMAVMNNIAFLQQQAVAADIMVLQVPSVGVRMALAVLGVTPVLLMYPFFQKSLVKGITLGSVKG